ncbi:MAG: S41 family peptidase [Pseudomonadota bacterium]
MARNRPVGCSGDPRYLEIPNVLRTRPITTLIALLLITVPAVGQTDKIPADQLKADFEALYTGLASAHFDLYANRSKEEYDTEFEAALAQLDTSLTRQQASVVFQRFAAFGNVAHARIDYDRADFEAYRANGGKILPLALRIVDGRSYVGENYSGNEDLKTGSEIVSINGRPMPDWLALTARNVSADTPYIAHSLLEFLFPMYLWLEEGPIDSFELELRDGAKGTKRITLAALNREQIEANREASDETFALDSTTREAAMLDGGVAYLRPGPFYNAEKPETPWDNRKFVRFIDESFESFLDAGATRLVVDLRQNPGGDNSFSDPMVAWFADEPFSFASAFRVRSSTEARASNQARLDANPGMTEGASVFFAERYAETPLGDTFEYPIPKTAPRDGKRFDGEVYVLIDRHSYSNAVTVAALVQDYGFGVILGEKTSDMATTYGAMETFSLPATGLVVGFPKAHIVRPSGELRTDGVTPDVPIRSPIVPATNDVVLEAALKYIAEAS